MRKNLLLLSGVVAALAVASPAQAQWTSFTPDNNGVEFWDNRSSDGPACNIGYVVTGVAGSSPNFPCSNQRPLGWLPYTGPVMNSFYAAPTFVINGGVLTVNVGPGTGGDIAGLDLDWGFWTAVPGDLDNKTFTNLNTVVTSATYTFADTDVWGFWVNTGTVQTSDKDAQFALFRGADNEHVLGMEDIAAPGGDLDYQDMIARVKFTGQVSEPSTLSLLALGGAAVFGFARRRRA